MTKQLGTLEELPVEYKKAMVDATVTPLWPLLRGALPPNKPNSTTQSCLWSFEKIRPLLITAGELTPVEKAERRVLILSDPGRGEQAVQSTGTIYIGLQLLLPGEAAPAHRHSPNAARLVLEGEGGFTVVNGEKLPMSEGDLILTPSGEWHDHGHDGDEPVIWLDALDLPIYLMMEGSYLMDEGPLQSPKDRLDSSLVEYAAAGMVPTRKLNQDRSKNSMMRFPWDRTEAMLRAMADANSADMIEADYVNPESGEDVLPTLGFSALMIRPEEIVEPPLRSSSAVFHVIKGSGQTVIDGKVLKWKKKDTFSVPIFSELSHSSDGEEPAFLMRIHDRPLQEKVKYYEERPRSS